MATVTLTVGQLAVALRISSSSMETLQTGVSSILTRHLATATALVERYAPDAPAAILDEAANASRRFFVRPTTGSVYAGNLAHIALWGASVAFSLA